MSKISIQKKLIECNSELSDMQQQLYQLKELDVDNNFPEYKEMAMKVARNSEKFTCKIRELVAETLFVKKRDLLFDLSKTQGITITDEECWVKIVMPFLLPKKKITQNCKFITEPLSYALRTYIEDTGRLRFSNSVICFRNIYKKDSDSGLIRDHDNIETKSVIDVITDYMLIDDTGRLCSNFYTTSLGDTDLTEIFILSKKDFLKWLDFYPIQID